jgi:hypothetical protein
MNLLLHKLNEMGCHNCKKAHWLLTSMDRPIKFESDFPAKILLNP